MEKRNRNIMILSIVALVLVLVGVTYAYFSAQITGIESASTISLTAGRMSIVYTEGDENVTVSNIYPREEAWVTKTFTLTANNTTDLEMNYEVGIQIYENTFKGGQLTFDLTGVGENGTRIPDIDDKALIGHDRFLKFGTGSFNEADGDTHVYTLKIYFKELGIDQNINQGAVFNGKIMVKEHKNTDINKCYTDDYVKDADIAKGKEYINGQYTYHYKQDGTFGSWDDIQEDGWGVILTDKNSTDPVNTALCTSVNDKPIVSMNGMFFQSQATSIDVSSFDTSNVTGMNRMFSNTPNITSLDLSGFDTSKVTNMEFMFFGSYELEDLNLSSFDTSNVTNMRFMFESLLVESLDLSNFDTSKVTYMTDMFNRMTKITTLDLSSFNTSNVTDMNQMFENNHATSIDVSSFDTRNVTGMNRMFGNMPNITSLDLRNFYTSKVTHFQSMFSNDKSLKTIYASDKFVFDSSLPDDDVFAPKWLFAECISLVGGAGTSYVSDKDGKEYAHIDGGPSNPGYFTDYRSKPNN